MGDDEGLCIANRVTGVRVWRYVLGAKVDEGWVGVIYFGCYGLGFMARVGGSRSGLGGFGPGRKW